MAEVQFGSNLIPIQDTFAFDSNDMGMLIVLASILTFSLDIFGLFQVPAVEESLPAMGGPDASMTSDPWFDEMIVHGHIVSPGAFALNIQSNNEGFENTSSVRDAQDHATFHQYPSANEYGDSGPEPVQNPPSQFKPIRPFNSEPGGTLSSAKAKRYTISIYLLLN